MRKLRCRFSRIYVQTVATEIDRRTTRKSKLAYNIDTIVSRSSIFLRYNSSRVGLCTRTKDLRISSSCGDSYEIQASHMILKAQVRVATNFHSKIEPKSPHQGWYFDCKTRHQQRPPSGTQINQDLLNCVCLWNFSNPIRLLTRTISILQLSVPVGN